MAWRRSRRESGGGLEVAETTTRAVLHRAAVVVRTAVGVWRELVVWGMCYRERATSLCIFPKDSSAGAGAWWERELDVCGDGQGC